MKLSIKTILVELGWWPKAQDDNESCAILCGLKSSEKHKGKWLDWDSFKNLVRKVDRRNLKIHQTEISTSHRMTGDYDYLRFYRENKNKFAIPMYPQRVYSEFWKGWDDVFGVAEERNRERIEEERRHRNRLLKEIIYTRMYITKYGGCPFWIETSRNREDKWKNQELWEKFRKESKTTNGVFKDCNEYRWQGRSYLETRAETDTEYILKRVPELSYYVDFEIDKETVQKLGVYPPVYSYYRHRQSKNGVTEKKLCIRNAKKLAQRGFFPREDSPNSFERQIYKEVMWDISYYDHSWKINGGGWMCNINGEEKDLSPRGRWVKRNFPELEKLVGYDNRYRVSSDPVFLEHMLLIAREANKKEWRFEEIKQKEEKDKAEWLQKQKDQEEKQNRIKLEKQEKQKNHKIEEERILASMSPTACTFCSSILTKGDKESVHSFIKRKYCSKKCRLEDELEKREKRRKEEEARLRSLPPRMCALCYGVLTIKEKESVGNFLGRKYCSKECRSKAASEMAYAQNQYREIQKQQTIAQQKICLESCV